MPQVQGIGTTWNLPNYAGELFTADPTQTPFLSMIGGLTGGKQTNNFDYPTAVLYDFPPAGQPEISEMDSAVAPKASHIAREQEKNVVQIHQEVIDLTYAKQSNTGRMSGLNTAGQQANPGDEKAWQIQQKLIKIARDVEYSFIQGKYQISTGADVANKTRGMLELCSSPTGNHIAAGGEVLDKDMLDQLFRDMAGNGAYFGRMVLFCNAFLKQAITNLYADQFKANMQTTQNVGGMNITEIETDFFKMGVVWDRFMPSDAILIADVAHIAPVFQAVPGKGVLFEEPLAKVGASDKVQIYGQIGLAHGPAFLHGAITGLKAQGTKRVYAPGLGKNPGDGLTAYGGKKESDLVKGMKINADCEVTGEFQHVTDYSSLFGKGADKDGYFFPFEVTQSGETLTIKTNGNTKEKSAPLADNRLNVVRLTKKADSEVEFLVDDISIGKFTFRGSTFAE